MMYSEYEIFGTNQQMRKVIEQACERLMETYGLRHVELERYCKGSDRDTAFVQGPYFKIGGQFKTAWIY